MLHFTMLALAMVSAEAFTSPLMSTRLPLSSFSASTSSAQMAVSRGGKPDTSFCYGLPVPSPPRPHTSPLLHYPGESTDLCHYHRHDYKQQQQQQLQ